MQGALLSTRAHGQPYDNYQRDKKSYSSMEMINSKHLPPTLTFEEVERILQLQTSDVWSLQIVFIFCLPHRFGSLFSSAASYKTWFQDFDNVKIGFLSGGIADDIWSERDTDKNQKDSGLILIWCIANDWRWLSIKEFSIERVLFCQVSSAKPSYWTLFKLT